MKLQLFILAMLCPFVCMCQALNVKGKVADEDGNPVVAATVSFIATGTGKTFSTITGNDGLFTLSNISASGSIEVSATGFETIREAINGRSTLSITLKRKAGLLDEAVVMAYGNTSRRLSTGNITKVSADAIHRQPVANPLAALQGQAPGVLVTQTSGIPGAAVRLLIRGQSSFTQGSEPFYIVDGVPFATGNTDINQFSSVLASSTGQGLSPFNSINPADIESIEILKDADATAIYGSRGANGVILITTRKGSSGKIKLKASVTRGNSYITRSMPMLNTADYLTMRREAFANDGVAPTVTSAPDLLVWDSSRYTDMQKLLLKGSAGVTEAHVSAGGGTPLTGFTLSGTYRNESTIFPGDMRDQRISTHFHFYNHAPNRRYSIQLSAQYVSDRNNLVTPDLTNAYRKPPNIPALYTPEGELNWIYKGVWFDNPMSGLLQTYQAVTDNLNANLQLSYRIWKGLHIKASAGYNRVQTAEEGITPIASINPYSTGNPTGSSRFGDLLFKSWIAEPQLTYQFNNKGLQAEFLLGATWQETIGNSSRITATGYTTDAILQSVSGAAALTAANNYNQYRYSALFGRVQLRYLGKWLLTLSGRRDGSSRFGPGKQMANFGSAGAGWIFTNEKYFKHHFKVISYGKLRLSYGIAGNDQIGNYQYTDSWRSTTNPYQGVPSLVPSRLFNADYSWEQNRKAEAALELGFFKDRLYLSVTRFQHRSSNQLVKYTLPAQTGFISIIKNLPALIQNTGWEIELKTNAKADKKIYCNNTFAFTIHRNKLVSYPGLAQSAYSTTYIVGKPLSLIYTYHAAGVNPATGVFTVEDVNRDNVINNKDRDYHGYRDPVWYGGMGQELYYKRWLLTVFTEFRKQTGRNYLASLINNPPGRMVNQPALVMKRWQKPGDQAPLPAFTNSISSAAYNSWNILSLSDGIYGDASYLRLKTLMISYQLPLTWKGRKIAEHARLYVSAQNLFTITNYEGGDPETQNLLTVPPLRTVTAGIQLTF